MSFINEEHKFEEIKYLEIVCCPVCGVSTKILLAKLANYISCCSCRSTYLPLAQIPFCDLEDETIEFDRYVLQVRDFCAVGYHSDDDGFAVVRGSQFSICHDDDLSPLYIRLIEHLITSKILVLSWDQNHYLLTETHCFDDYHTAASLILGHDEDGDLVWTLVDEEGAVEEDQEDNEEEEDEESEENGGEYDNGIHFLDFSREQIRDLIVEVLEKRPNNSVKRDELVTEILRHIGVRTSGNPRLQFNSQVMLEVQWLGRRRVLKRYKVKNNRVRLSEFYRTRLAMTAQSEDSAQERRAVPVIDRKTSTPDTIESLKAEIARLRRGMELLLEGEDIE